VALSDACLEALYILGALYGLETSLSVLEVAPVGAVVEKIDDRVNLECLLLQALAVLSEHFNLRY
jgi:hypothetical protein